MQNCQAPRAREDARESSRPVSHARLPPDWRSHSEARLGSLPYKACHLCCAGTAVLAPAVVECAHARASPSAACCLQPSYPRPIYPTHAPLARTPLLPNIIACIGTHVSDVEGSLSRATVPLANNRTASHVASLLPSFCVAYADTVLI